jgi:hypothetical protein
MLDRGPLAWAKLKLRFGVAWLARIRSENNEASA